MDILYCHSGDLTPWPMAACAEHNYRLQECSPKIDTDDPANIYTETGTHKLYWAPAWALYVLTMAIIY